MNSKIIREGAQITIEITNIEEISEVMLGEIIHNIIITKKSKRISQQSISEMKNR